MRQLARLSLTGLNAAALLPASAAAATGGFHSPSGNIGCYISPSGARCDISKHDWPTPAKPKSCDLDYGGGLAVGRQGPRGLLLRRRHTAAPGPVLPYGSSGRRPLHLHQRGERHALREPPQRARVPARAPVLPPVLTWRSVAWAALATASAALGAPAAGHAASFAQFQSPSGNIACAMSITFGVRCDIAVRDWAGRRPTRGRAASSTTAVTWRSRARQGALHLRRRHPAAPGRHAALRPPPLGGALEVHEPDDGHDVPQPRNGHGSRSRASGTGSSSAPATVPGHNDEAPPEGGASDIKPAATYSPGPLRAKYHRRCGA